ncbi:MAG: acetyl-CoA carboxylase biotin carboxyl carrier protein subunit [Bacteroidetes bacterium]|nr:acetyl-CoA carboxylase biotin carboxyl carrier protein subunit [Bacteroidota bacterium]
MEENEKEQVLPEPEFISFQMEHVTFKTLANRTFLMRKPFEPEDQKKITAFIPGTIVKVCVKEKQKVKAGETLLDLQAMKMNNHLLSPFNTVVKKIYVKQGERVTKNQLLVELK